MYVFVRYVKVHDARKLSKALNNVYFVKIRVWPNAELFDEFGISSRLSREKKVRVLREKK